MGDEAGMTSPCKPPERTLRFASTDAVTAPAAVAATATTSLPAVLKKMMRARSKKHKAKKTSSGPVGASACVAAALPLGTGVSPCADAPSGAIQATTLVTRSKTPNGGEASSIPCAVRPPDEPARSAEPLQVAVRMDDQSRCSSDESVAWLESGIARLAAASPPGTAASAPAASCDTAPAGAIGMSSGRSLLAFTATQAVECERSSELDDYGRENKGAGEDSHDLAGADNLGGNNASGDEKKGGLEGAEDGEQGEVCYSGCGESAAQGRERRFSARRILLGRLAPSHRPTLHHTTRPQATDSFIASHVDCTGMLPEQRVMVPPVIHSSALTSVVAVSSLPPPPPFIVTGASSSSIPASQLP